MFRDNSPVNIQWATPFDALLARLDEIAANDATTRITNYQLTARAILRLLKDGTTLTNGAVLTKIIDDDKALTGGARSAFDTGRWYSIIQDTATELRNGATEL